MYKNLIYFPLTLVAPEKYPSQPTLLTLFFHGILGIVNRYLALKI